MKVKFKIAISIIYILYLATILLTNISLTGFWTDIVFLFIFSVFTLFVLFQTRNEHNRIFTVLNKIVLFCMTILCLLSLIYILNPFGSDIIKLRSFYYRNVENRLFNAYFQPVGAYSGGEGNFWITESPKYFPVIEIEKYYEHAILWNFSVKEWDGKPVDQNEIVREYIKDEVLDLVN